VDYPVLDAVVGATAGEGILVGADIPVRTGAEGWAFVVVHVLPHDALVAAGDRAEVTVDAGYRAALSAGHTGCHLASLALDRALADAWGKDVPTDALGSPGFDALACQSSRIHEDALSCRRPHDRVEHRVVHPADRERAPIGGLVGPSRVDGMERGAVEHDTEAALDREHREHLSLRGQSTGGVVDERVGGNLHAPILRHGRIARNTILCDTLHVKRCRQISPAP
jgi:hypothetical protein